MLLIKYSRYSKSKESYGLNDSNYSVTMYAVILEPSVIDII